MKERWELICSGTPRSVIKVSIYVRDVLHGKLDANNSYVTVSHDPSDFGSGVRSGVIVNCVSLNLCSPIQFFLGYIVSRTEFTSTYCTGIQCLLVKSVVNNVSL